MRARDHERIVRSAVGEREHTIACLQRTIERQRAELERAYAEIDRISDLVHPG